MLSMTRVEAIPLDAMQAGHALGLGDLPRVPRSRSTASPRASTSCPTCRSARCWSGCSASTAPSPAGRPPRTSWPRSRACCTRRWTPAAAAGRRSGCLPTAAWPTSATSTARPMPTDCMPDETAIAFAEVLGERNEGFMQMTYVSGDTKHDLRHFEELAEVSGRPMIYNVVVGHDNFPDRHRKQLKWLELVPGAGHPRLRPGRHHRRRVHLHHGGLEPLRRLRGLDGGHHRHPRGAPPQAGRPGPPGQAARRQHSRSRTAR